jgi:hypothetical protein
MAGGTRQAKPQLIRWAAFGGFSVGTHDGFSGCADSPGTVGDSRPAAAGGTLQPSRDPAKAPQKSDDPNDRL